MARLQMVTNNKADISEQAAVQISTRWACKIQRIFPPMAPGAVPTAMSAQVHFATLIEVLVTAIEFGMDSAPEIYVERVRSLRRELKLVLERLNTYLQLHYMLLTPFETKVRNILVEVINHGTDEGFYELAMQADEFQGNHQDVEPMPGTRDVVQVPKFRRLRKLLKSDGKSVWQNGPSTRRQQRAHRRPAAKNARPRSLPRQRRRRRRRTRTRAGSVSPHHGRAGRRGMARPAAAMGASTATSTATPTHPTLPHPPPHQRTRSASTAAIDSAEDPATAAATSTVAPAAAAAAGGCGGRGSAAKRGQLQQDGWRRKGRRRRTWRRQRGARRRWERRLLTVWALPTGRADSRGGGGGQNELVPCLQTQ